MHESLNPVCTLSSPPPVGMRNPGYPSCQQCGFSLRHLCLLVNAMYAKRCCPENLLARYYIGFPGSRASQRSPLVSHRWMGSPLPPPPSYDLNPVAVSPSLYMCTGNVSYSSSAFSLLQKTLGLRMGRFVSWGRPLLRHATIVFLWFRGDSTCVATGKSRHRFYDQCSKLFVQC